MDPRRWWLLAGAVPVLSACAVAASDPALRPLGDAAVVAAGLIAVAVLLVGAGRTARPTAWRLLAAAPLFPIIGVVLAAVVAPSDPLELVVLRWVPTVPGYLLAIVGLLGLVPRARLRAGRRVVVEQALFFTACLVVVTLLVVGPDGSWTALRAGERLVLGAAVVVTSATMAAALTVLSLVEARRRTTASVLLVGAITLTLGRGLGTSAMISGLAGVADVARFPVAAGLLLLALAVLLDTDRGPAVVAGRRSRWPLDVGQLLPHLALLAAVTTVGAVAISGERPSPGIIAGLVVCVALAAVHRWLTVCDEHRLGNRLRRSEAYFRSLVESGTDAVVILDDRLRVTGASPALERSLGTAAAGLLGRPLLDAVHPEDRPGLATVLSGEPGGTPAPGLFLIRLRDADGVWRYLEAGVADLRADSDVGAVVLHCRDMTDRLEREQALQAVAYTDPMTGLPNRAGFLRLLQETLSDPSRSGAVTLLIIELDGLAAARDQAGREEITRAVAEIGRRLRGTVRGEDVVARMGGGAFAVLAEGDDADADRLAARCLAVIEQPLLTGAGILDLTAGVGLVPVEDGLDVDGLLARADLAVRAAHAAGAGRASRYLPALGEAAARSERLRADLREARARGELFLLFSPIVSLKEQRVTGIEASLQWRHPELGEIPQAEFFDLAERSGLIGELMRWAMEEATTALAPMPSAGDPPRVGLKVPAGYVATGTLVPDVEHALRRSGLPAQRLVLQISADIVMADDERTGLDVSTLRFMGVHVALDGFGSGSSALAHLTRLPIDIVKLDRSLISRIDRDPQSRALCESVIGIGHALGLDVVAEGVETAAQLGALCGFGCDFAQGFAISRPLSLAALTTLLAERAGQLWPGLVGSR